MSDTAAEAAATMDFLKGSMKPIVSQHKCEHELPGTEGSK